MQKYIYIAIHIYIYIYGSWQFVGMKGKTTFCPVNNSNQIKGNGGALTVHCDNAKPCQKQAIARASERARARER